MGYYAKRFMVEISQRQSNESSRTRTRNCRAPLPPFLIADVILTESASNRLMFRWAWFIINLATLLRWQASVPSTQSHRTLALVKVIYKMPATRYLAKNVQEVGEPTLVLLFILMYSVFTRLAMQRVVCTIHAYLVLLPGALACLGVIVLFLLAIFLWRLSVGIAMGCLRQENGNFKVLLLKATVTCRRGGAPRN